MLMFDGSPGARPTSPVQLTFAVVMGNIPMEAGLKPPKAKSAETPAS